MGKSKWDTVKDKLILVESWARDGLTDEQIAHNLGIRKFILINLQKVLILLHLCKLEEETILFLLKRKWEMWKQEKSQKKNIRVAKTKQRTASMAKISLSTIYREKKNMKKLKQILLIHRAIIGWKNHVFGF